MNEMFVILWICNIVVAVSCLFLLSYRKGLSFQNVHLNVPASDHLISSSCHTMMEDREYSLKWPQLAIAFEKDERTGTAFLVWRGAVKSDRKLLFVFYHEQSYSAFMQACSQIFEANACPANSFEVLQVTDDMHLNEQILYRMKTTGEPFYGVIVDDSGFMNISDHDPLCAMIGTGSLSQMILQIQGDTDEYDWLVEQKPQKIFPSVRTEERARLFQLLMSQLHPKSEGMTWKAKTENLLRKLPVFTPYFYPQIIHDGDTVIVWDETLEDVEKDVRILCDHGQKSGIVFTDMGKSKGFSDWPMNHELYDRIVNALHASDHLMPIIPYRMALSQQKDIRIGCSVMHFAPMVNGVVDSSSLTICFYEKLLLDQKR